MTSSKRTSFLIGAAMAAGLAASAAADPSPAAGIAEVGHINGLALACAHPDVAATAGKAVIARVAKTRDNGAAFEQATQAAFVLQNAGSAPCPSRAELAVRLEIALAGLPSGASATSEASVAAAQAALPPAASPPIAAPAEPPAPPNPRYLLQDVSGRAILDSDFHGRFQLVTFGYTFCPDVCPTTLAEMTSVLKQLGERADRVQPIFVSVDPERDTLKVLKTYTGFFDPRILGATASPELLRRSADSFGVRFEKILPAGADPSFYTVDHTAGMFLLAPDGQLVARFTYASPVPQVVERIVAEMDARPESNAIKSSRANKAARP